MNGDVPSACDVLVVVGEPSGDQYGGAIVRRLKELHPELRVAAMGGPALAEAGADIVHGIDGLAVMGFIPVLLRLREFTALGRFMAEQIRSRRPRVVLTIDYPGFNLRLVRSLVDLRAAGTRFVHLVAPQVWAWKPRRAKSIARTVDRLLCFFPFEPPLFSRFGCQADFIGHPLLDLIPPAAQLRSGMDERLGISADRKLLLLAPGSREREIRLLLPIFDRAAQALARRLPHPPAIVIAGVPDRELSFYRRWSDFPVVSGCYRALCARAHVGLITSGTATLEAGLLGLPHVIAYRTDPFSAVLARRLVITDHVGLPNIVAGRRIIPEVLQDQLDAPRLVAHLLRLWDGPRRAQCLADLADVRTRLGSTGAMERIARCLSAELHPTPNQK
jgi:lipid-A-disaccharide synthase